MIKTHSGEIDPRLGDYCEATCLHELEDSEPKTTRFKIVEVSPSHVLGNDGFWYAQQSCTLLHRPFMVGDEVEVYDELPNGAENWFSKTLKAEVDCVSCWHPKTSPSLEISRKH